MTRQKLCLTLLHFGGYAVKRLAISMSTLLIVLSCGAGFLLAGVDEGRPAKSLHQAAVDGDMNNVQALISSGADINEKNMMGWTPLHAAVRNQQKAVAAFLVDKGADVNAKNNSGQTALHFAIETSQKDVAEVLIAKGADINAISRGENALSMAQKRGDKEIVDLLLKHGAKEPPANWGQDELYGPTEQAQVPISPAPGIRRQPDASTVTRSDPNALANILADPNAIIARIKTFEGLDKALSQVDGRARYEVREWLEKKTDNRVGLARAVDLQVRAEIRFIRDVAVEEKANKTTGAIDALLLGRQEQLKRLVAEVEEEIKAQRPIRGTRGRYSGRYSSAGQSYPQEQPTRGRTTPYYSGTRLPREGVRQQEGFAGREGAPGVLQRAAPSTGGTNQIEIDMWLQRDAEGRLDLADAVHNQVAGQILPIRKIAVDEKANKATAAIDGVLLDRQKRFDKLVQALEKEIAGSLGRRDTYYNQGQRSVPGRQSGAYSPGTTERDDSLGPAPRRR
jgi:hypothetical protein